MCFLDSGRISTKISHSAETLGEMKPKHPRHDVRKIKKCQSFHQVQESVREYLSEYVHVLTLLINLFSVVDELKNTIRLLVSPVFACLQYLILMAIFH